MNTTIDKKDKELANLQSELQTIKTDMSMADASHTTDHPWFW